MGFYIIGTTYMNDFPFVCACAKCEAKTFVRVLGSQGLALCLYSPICLQPHAGGTGWRWEDGRGGYDGEVDRTMKGSEEEAGR